MSHSISPYIAFNGQAREALDLYASIFGGTPRYTTFGDFNVEGMGSPEGIMHGQLETDSGVTIMASDSTKPGDELVRGGMSLVVWGDDEATLRRQFSALAEGGTVNMPFEKQMWGDHYGDLTDRFGISWGFNLGEGGEG